VGGIGKALGITMKETASVQNSRRVRDEGGNPLTVMDRHAMNKKISLKLIEEEGKSEGRLMTFSE